MFLVQLLVEVSWRYSLTVHNPRIFNIFLDYLVSIFELKHDFKFVSQRYALSSWAAAWFDDPNIGATISHILWIVLLKIFIVEDDPIEAIHVWCPPRWFGWTLLPGWLHLILDLELLLDVWLGILQVVFVWWRHLTKSLQILRCFWILHWVGRQQVDIFLKIDIDPPF